MPLALAAVSLGYVFELNMGKYSPLKQVLTFSRPSENGGQLGIH